MLFSGVVRYTLRTSANSDRCRSSRVALELKTLIGSMLFRTPAVRAWHMTHNPTKRSYTAGA
jgi:hypothetical protein